jgi:hypothetical protein
MSKTISSIVLLSSAVFLVGIGSGRAENVALHKEVAGFSSPQIMHVPFAFATGAEGAKAVDGDLNTFASNCQSFPWFVEVRLGDAYPVDCIVLVQPQGGASKHYSVKVADDGFNWEEIAEVKDGTPGSKEFRFATRWVSSVRIISFTPTQLGSSDGMFTPAEIEVYRSDRTPVSPKPAKLDLLWDTPPETYQSRYPLGDETEDLNINAPQWLLETFRRGDLDIKITEPEKRKVIIDQVADAGMKLVDTMFWDHDFTVFPSRWVAMNPKLRGKGDLFGQCLDQIHARGMKLTCYNCPVTSPRILEHPRWIMRNLNGELQVNAGWYEGCWNSPYLDHYIDRLVEAATKYPIDGFWLDGFWVHEGCACDYCKTKFKRETGLNYPKKYDWNDPTFLTWRDWRGRQASEAVRRVARALHAVRPDLALMINTYSTQSFPLVYPWASTYESQFMPCVSEEHGLSFIEDMTFHHFMANYVRSVAGDRRDAELWLYQGSNSSVPLVDLRLRVLTQIAAGAKPELGARCGNWQRLKTVYDDIAAREPWLTGTKRVKWAALLVSDRMKYFDAAQRTPGSWPSLDDITYMWSYERGLYRAMIEEHLPVSMITDADLEKGRLDGYKVLLLGNATCLNEKACETIRKFVKNGGGVVATFDTSSRDGFGRPQNDFVLSDLLQCHRKEVLTPATGQVRIHSKKISGVDEILADFTYEAMMPNDTSTFLPWNGPLVKVETANDNTVCLELETDQGKFPMALLGEFGKGRVAYFPAAIDNTLFKSSTPWAAELITAAVRQVASEPAPVVGHAPSIVTFTSFDQPAKNRMVVHLLNDYSSQGRVPNGGNWTRRDFATIADLSVTLRGKNFTKATLEPGHQPLKMEKHGDDYVVTIPKLDLHRMVVVDYTPEVKK